MPHPPLHTLVLTAAPGAPCLDEGLVRGVAALMPQRDGPVAGRWLAPGEAWEVTSAALRETDIPRLRDEVRATLGDLPVDVNVVAGDGAYRRKRLLVADMESTIIEQEMLDELADYAGLRGPISEITTRAMRGEIDFVVALTERVRLLAGLDARVLDEVFARVTLVPGAEALVRTMNAHGAACALVSGGFTCFTSRVAARLGFHSHYANALEVSDGKLTGTVAQPILGADAKLATLKSLAVERGLSPGAALTVGDGANDIPMLSEAGLGVAYHPKPKVAAHMARLDNGAVVEHGDLTALLYLQGYTKDDFAS